MSVYNIHVSFGANGEKVVLTSPNHFGTSMDAVRLGRSMIDCCGAMGWRVLWKPSEKSLSWLFHEYVHFDYEWSDNAPKETDNESRKLG